MSDFCSFTEAPTQTASLQHLRDLSLIIHAHQFKKSWIPAFASKSRASKRHGLDHIFGSSAALLPSKHHLSNICKDWCLGKVSWQRKSAGWWQGRQDSSSWMLCLLWHNCPNMSATSWREHATNPKETQMEKQGGIPDIEPRSSLPDSQEINNVALFSVTRSALQGERKYCRHWFSLFFFRPEEET